MVPEVGGDCSQKYQLSLRSGCLCDVPGSGNMPPIKAGVKPQVKWFAASQPDGLEWAIEQVTGEPELTAGSSSAHDASAALQDQVHHREGDGQEEIDVDAAEDRVHGGPPAARQCADEDGDQ